MTLIESTLEERTVLSAREWRAREAEHHVRADALTADHRARASRQQKHPIEDFLFTYYGYKPAILRRWHPGAGVELADAATEPRAAWRWYAAGRAPGSVTVDTDLFRRERAAQIDAIDRILARTAARPGAFGCFGLHEWAMVYRQPDRRHDVPLRLGQDATDDVVDAHELRCTHFDAFRFFTPAAEPLNQTMLTREHAHEAEQPGCLHAGMDVYKWGIKLSPLVPGDLLLDAFELARDIRWLDMQASPYDMRAWGAEPVEIETPAGKAEYVRRQRDFAVRSNALRLRMREAIAR